VSCAICGDAGVCAPVARDAAAALSLIELGNARRATADNNVNEVGASAAAAAAACGT
jgi:hypothetical protein